MFVCVYPLKALLLFIIYLSKNPFYRIRETGLFKNFIYLMYTNINNMNSLKYYNWIEFLLKLFLKVRFFYSIVIND